MSPHREEEEEEKRALTTNYSIRSERVSKRVQIKIKKNR